MPLALAELERMVLTHLSIPRSVQGITTVLLRAGVPTGEGDPTANVADILEELHRAGMVTNLGSHGNAESVVDAIGKGKGGKDHLPMPDVKRENLQGLVGRRPEMLLGDQWYMTARGLEALTS